MWGDLAGEELISGGEKRAVLGILAYKEGSPAVEGQKKDWRVVSEAANDEVRMCPWLWVPGAEPGQSLNRTRPRGQCGAHAGGGVGWAGSLLALSGCGHCSLVLAE